MQRNHFPCCGITYYLTLDFSSSSSSSFFFNLKFVEVTRAIAMCKNDDRCKNLCTFLLVQITNENPSYIIFIEYYGWNTQFYFIMAK
jgi:hypothetical protein